MPASNGRETVFNDGIKNNDSRPADTSANFLVTQNSDGTQGKIQPGNIPLSKNYFNHNFVKESKIRETNSNYVYSGAVLTVGAGGTYSTISAAISAASSGDIIQLADGVYNTASESGGYLIINSATKRLLIRGNSTNNSAVVIRQSAAATYCLRLRVAFEVTFQNLTIESNQGNNTVYMNMGSPEGEVKSVFKNCVIKNTSSAENIITVGIIGVPAASAKYEFIDCDIYRNNGTGSGSLPIGQSAISDANRLLYDLPIIINRCNIFGRITFQSSNKIIMYDSVIKNNQNFVSLHIGSDTLAPTYINSHLDVRGCTFMFENGFTNHNVLIGRGTKDVYFANNNIKQSSDVDSLSLGLVIKSIAANINDVIFEGNYVEAPRPLYLKGSQNTVVRENTTFSNWGDSTNGYGLEINNPLNPDGEISSIGNVIEFNKFTGNKDAIGLGYAGTTLAITSFNLCTVRSNSYNIPKEGLYINAPTTTWETRNLTTKQDSNSILYYY